MSDRASLVFQAATGQRLARVIAAIAALAWSVRADDGAAGEHWAFARLSAESSSPSGAAGTGAIDAFIARELAAAGLAPAPEAGRRTLVLRAYRVLHGLAPEPDELDRYLESTRVDWYERLIDGLLASPRFGERFARHWLDLVRYAESNGYETNRPRKSAYHYRDWVIASLNDDLPYDRFVAAQIAGDRLGDGAATGFLVAGPHDIVKSPDPELTKMQRADELADFVDATSTTFLSLTAACARCHDHKYDPIPQEDFYALAAVFAGVEHGERPLERAGGDRAIAELAAIDRDIAAARASLHALVRLGALEAERARVEAERVGPLAWAGTFSEPGPTHVLYRGDPLSPRQQVEPRALSMFSGFRLSPDAPESDRRLALATWITSDASALAARVAANRIWQHVFGRGLVTTPNDFGANGAAPSHPELLDWLASELIRARWSIKHLARAMVTSRTFRQSSAPDARALGIDAGNRLCWRFAPRRHEAEVIRDAMLAASGTLELRMGGPGYAVVVEKPGNVYAYAPKTEFGPDDRRRSIYAHQIRGEQDATFGVFDCPDGGQSAPKRARSTTAIQALHLLNSPFVIEQAAILAARVAREAGDAEEARIRRAFRRVLLRGPSPRELDDALGLVREHGLAALCRALFNANELLFVE